ncbi:hypothetical protein RJ639_043827 [Escallonia herrerae]|uniref:Fe2OG dioxygenase domain-containing protein n=1 Tax=Escallonia herrerae TaxID=1293975 RepID=A0AA88WAG8_9ASTE|nr:hypothetical protein RJ639_043827 [Escallonia herrerae]
MMEVERVQGIASVSIPKDTIPPEFIRPENEQPALTTFPAQAAEVPVIDFVNNDEKELVDLIFDASCKWGLFQIVNHDIPSDVIRKLQDVGKEFFELTQHEKEIYANKPPGAKSVEGYGTKLQKEVEGKKGWVDHLFHKIWPPAAINYQFWPKNPPSYSFLKGLQVFQDNNWYDVKYIPDALIVHVGDQIQIVSNGKYKSVLHRTMVNKEKTRMSWPVFLEPPSELEVGPHPKLVSDENPPKYKRKKYSNYVYCKLNKLPQ